MKKITKVLLTLFLIFSFNIIGASAEGNFEVYVDEKVNSSMEFLNESGAIFACIEDVFEYFGYDTQYHNGSDGYWVSVEKDDETLLMFWFDEGLSMGKNSIPDKSYTNVKKEGENHFNISLESTNYTSRLTHISLMKEVDKNHHFVRIEDLETILGFEHAWSSELKILSIYDNKSLPKNITVYDYKGNEVEINSSFKDKYLKIGYTEDYNALPKMTVYALDGRTKEILVSNEKEENAVGWYSFKPMVVYSADGRQEVININDKEAWFSVGWYSEPMATVYAADGRTLVIPSSQIEAYKAVGWYYTITMYAPDGRTSEVLYPDVQAWINVGWSTEPVVTMYSTDDRTIAVPASQIEAYKAVGWLTHEQYQAHVQKKQNQMMDVYASVLLRQYRAKMKDPSSFKLNAVYAGYDSSLYAGYNFVAIVDVSGKNSYGGITRSTYTMLLETGSGKFITDLKGYADRQADGAWGSNKLKWMDVSINALKAQANASSKYTKLDTNMITRLVLSQ